MVLYISLSLFVAFVINFLRDVSLHCSHIWRSALIMWLQPLALMGGTKTIYSNTHVGQFDTSVPDEVGILA